MDLSLNPHGIYLLEPATRSPLCVFPFHEIFSSRIVRQKDDDNGEEEESRSELNQHVDEDESDSFNYQRQRQRRPSSDSHRRIDRDPMDSDEETDSLLSKLHSESDDAEAPKNIKRRRKNQNHRRRSNKRAAIYLDIKCGTSMVQKVTRIETDFAEEIAALVGRYIEILHSDEIEDMSSRLI